MASFCKFRMQIFVNSGVPPDGPSLVTDTVAFESTVTFRHVDGQEAPTCCGNNGSVRGSNDYLTNDGVIRTDADVKWLNPHMMPGGQGDAADADCC